jgi:hypothetical protein
LFALNSAWTLLALRTGRWSLLGVGSDGRFGSRISGDHDRQHEQGGESGKEPAQAAPKLVGFPLVLRARPEHEKTRRSGVSSVSAPVRIRT